MNLVKLIAEHVQPYEKPAVYLSGGLDSTIVLHHLREKLPQTKIYTYTAEFFTSGDELGKAKEVAKHYNATHKVVPVDHFIETLPEILKLFDRPRFNVWPWWLARQAKLDGRKTIYIGEGSDEIFGGYYDKSYLQAWAGQLTYIIPTYRTIHNYYNLDLETPFLRLPWKGLLDLYTPPDKIFLKSAYKNILPDFVINAPVQPPGFCKYAEFLTLDLTEEDCTDGEAKARLQKLTTRMWLKENR